MGPGVAQTSKSMSAPPLQCALLSRITWDTTLVLQRTPQHSCQVRPAAGLTASLFLGLFGKAQQKEDERPKNQRLEGGARQGASLPGSHIDPGDDPPRRPANRQQSHRRLLGL